MIPRCDPVSAVTAGRECRMKKSSSRTIYKRVVIILCILLVICAAAAAKIHPSDIFRFQFHHASSLSKSPVSFPVILRAYSKAERTPTASGIMTAPNESTATVTASGCINGSEK